MIQHHCPKCDAPTHRVMTAWAYHPQADMPPGYVAYYDPNAKSSIWGGPPVIGYLAPEVCSGCDLVSWFAVRDLEGLAATG